MLLVSVQSRDLRSPQVACETVEDAARGALECAKRCALLKACKPLEEYAWFVERVRQNNRPNVEGKRIGIEAAVDRAVEEMPGDFVIRELLLENKAEVKDMCLTEYDEKEAMELFREEGREQTLQASIRNVMETLGVTVERAMDALRIPAAERSRFAAMLDE